MFNSIYDKLHKYFGILIFACCGKVYLLCYGTILYSKKWIFVLQYFYSFRYESRLLLAHTFLLFLPVIFQSKCYLIWFSEIKLSKYFYLEVPVVKYKILCNVRSLRKGLIQRKYYYVSFFRILFVFFLLVTHKAI